MKYLKLFEKFENLSDEDWGKMIFILHFFYVGAVESIRSIIHKYEGLARYNNYIDILEKLNLVSYYYHSDSNGSQIGYRREQLTELAREWIEETNEIIKEYIKDNRLKGGKIAPGPKSYSLNTDRIIMIIDMYLHDKISWYDHQRNDTNNRRNRNELERIFLITDKEEFDLNESPYKLTTLGKKLAMTIIYEFKLKFNT